MKQAETVRRILPPDFLSWHTFSVMCLQHWPRPRTKRESKRQVREQLRRAAEEYLQALGTLGVLDGLSDGQRVALATRVRDATWLYSVWKDRRPRLASFKTEAKRGPGQIRKLQRKLERIRRQLKDVLDYTEGLVAESRQGERGNVFLARTLQHSFVPYVQRALAALDNSAWQEIQQGSGTLETLRKAKGQIRLPDPGEISERARQSGVVSENAPQDPRGDAAAQVVEFLVTKCGLEQNEAQVRTAKIANAFWEKSLSYRPKYEGIERWKGSDAIRKAVTRRKRTTDT